MKQRIHYHSASKVSTVDRFRGTISPSQMRQEAAVVEGCPGSKNARAVDQNWRHHLSSRTNNYSK